MGRAEELMALCRALDDARSGLARTVLIGGEAGIGKSRLVEAFGERAADADCLVLRGVCAPIADGLLPYGPLGDVFRDAAAQMGVTSLLEQLQPFGQVLGLVAPDLLPRALGPPDSMPGPLLLGAIRRLTERSAIVVVLEDVHWADASTLATLALCTRSLGSTPAVWVATYRADELARRHPETVAELDRLGALRIELDPLSSEDVALQIAGIRSAPAPGAVVQRIFARSEGNPLFTEELLAVDEADETLPVSLRQLLLRRVHELPEHARRVLATAACAGRVVDHRLLARVADVDEGDLDDAIRMAVAGAVLECDARASTYSFRHALLHEAVESTLLPGDRVELHRRLAEVLAADVSLAAGRGAAASAELAHHWEEAGEFAKALAAHVRAGAEAEAVHAAAEALVQYEHAIALWDRTPQHCGPDAREALADLYERAARTACLSGDTTRSVRLLDEALGRREINEDAATAALLYERLGRYLWVARADEQLIVAMYERAIDRIPATPSVQRARVLAGFGQILMLLSDYRRSATVCEEALSAALEVGARDEEGHARNTLGVDLANLDRVDEGITQLRTALSIAHETGVFESLHRAHTNLALTLMSGPRLAAARSVAAEGLELTRRHNVPATQGAYAVSTLAEILYFEGRWDEADELISATTADPGFPIGFVELIRVAAHLASARGRFDEAEQLIASTDADGSSRGDTGTRGRLAALRIEHSTVRGDRAAALRELEATWADLTASNEAHQLALLTVLGLAALSTGDRVPDWLEQLHEVAVARCGERTAPPVTQALLAQARAERDRVDGCGSPGAWADIGKRWNLLGRPYPAAWAGLREAEAHLASYDRQAAATALTEAAAIAGRLGAVPLQGMVEDLTRRARLSPNDAAGSRGDVPTVAGLSARELEVLELVADGCTNREIANELFISVRTAGVHVSHILTKLGVKNRSAAVATARRAGVDVSANRARAGRVDR